MKRITEGQRRVLEFIRSFYLMNDQVPPMQAIADHFGWSSCNAAQTHVKGLARRGYLERNAVGRWKFTPDARPSQIPQRCSSMPIFRTGGSSGPTNGIV